MDQLYFLDGYYEGKYFVYTADASASFTPYIASQYIDSDFFEDKGSVFTLTGTLTRQTYQEFAASFTSAFTFTGLVGRRQSAVASLSSAFTTSATVVKTAGVTPSLTSAVTVATVSEKTARSSVTLSSIANLSAQAARTRALTSSIAAAATATTIAKKTTQTQSALASAFTQSSQAQRSRTTTASFASAVTQTTNTIKTARASIGLTSAFAPVITANASVSNGAGLTGTFTATAQASKIARLQSNRNFGVRSSDTSVPRLKLSGLPSLGLPYNTIGLTVSIWARRKTTNTFSTLWTYDNGPGGGNPNSGLVVDNNDVRLRSYYDPDEPGATWNNQAPVDTNWHHYLFLTASSGFGDSTGRYFRLWVDGVYKGESSYFASGIGSFDNNGYIQFGSGINRSTGIIYDEAATTDENIDFAQIWVGSTGIDTINPIDFYDGGYVELGATGRGQFNQLSTPYIYSRLSGVYTYERNGAPISVAAAEQPILTPTAQGYFNLTATSENVLQTASTLQSASTFTVTATKVVRSSISFASAVTLSATAQKIITVTKALSSLATMTTVGQRLRFGVGSFASAVTVTATAYKVKPYASAINSQFTVSATIDNRTRSQSAALTSQFTVTARPTDRTREGISLEAGAFTLTVTAKRTRGLVSNITSRATVTADAKKVIICQGNFTARFTIFSIVYRAIIAQATLQANGFVLSQGDILNFDPCREIRAEQETRLAHILPENRLVIVESETRRLKVAQETRVLRVDYETRVNILQC